MHDDVSFLGGLNLQSSSQAEFIVWHYHTIVFDFGDIIYSYIMLYHIPHNPHIVKQHDWFVNATKIVSAWASTFRISQLRKGTLSCFSLSKPPPSQTQHVGEQTIAKHWVRISGMGQTVETKTQTVGNGFLCVEKRINTLQAHLELVSSHLT